MRHARTMPPSFSSLVVAVVAVLLVLSSACSKDNKDCSDCSDAGSDSDADTDVDTDTDSDVDTDSDADTDTDTDGDTDTDADTDSDGDFVPNGCEIISNHAQWTGELGFSEDRMAWTDQDPISEMPEIWIRELSTGSNILVVDDAASHYYDHATMWNDWVFWDESDGVTPYDRELFRKNILTSETEQLTDTSCSSTYPIPGEEKVAFFRSCEGDAADAGSLYVLELSSLDTTLITNNALGNPPGFDYDGTQWLVWLDENGTTGVNWLWKYDVLNGVGPTIAQNGMLDIVAPKIDNGIVYFSAWDSPADLTNLADVKTHDLSTGTNSWLFHSPWDQVQVTTSGRVAAYADTETLAHKWFEDQTAQIEFIRVRLSTHATANSSIISIT